MATYSEKVTTPKFRVGFERILKGETTKDGGMKYSITMVFAAGDELKALQKAVKDAASEEWGDKAKFKTPLLKHTQSNDQGERYCDKMPNLYEDDDDAIFIRAVSYQKVGLVDGKLNDIFEAEDFYSGCFARATVVAKTWEYEGKKGVSFYVNNVQKLADGERVGGGGKAAASSDFEAVEEDVEDLFGDEEAA